MRLVFLISCLTIFIVLSMGILNGCQKTNNIKENDIQSVYPSNQREKEDLQVIEQLKKVGSDLSKPHSIEHHFTVYGDKKKADGAISELKSQDYEVVDIEEGVDNGQKYYYFDAIKSIMVKPDIIFTQTSAMEEIAEKYDIVYDGWGCMTVK